ncbi:hypothetical protein Cgig2_012111 [Carnegiea gigantea]|uniref:Uncharacterized protein n=1 Tax=Carnegiea gigantea TaxID=171969 RepID=A0A9Q1K129_9CARY|nr:hypothetical protein Cgig2_012111 [Carnegiea gigantea]
MANDQAAPSYTLDEALLSVGFGKFQYFVFAYAGMGWISDAMEMMLLSFVGPAARSQWSLSAQQESLVTSVVFIGMLESISVCSNGYVGSTSAKCSSTKLRSTGCISVFGWVWSGRGSSAAILACGVRACPEERYLAALPSLVLVAFYIMTPESPRYLCSKGDKKAAFLILEKMAKANGRELPSGTLITNLETELQQPHICLPVEVESSSSNPKETKPCQKVKGPLMKALRPTLLLWALFIGNAFSYYGIVLLTTELNNTRRSCSSPAKATLHKSDDINYKNVFAASFAEFPGLILAGLIVDRIGRTRTMGGMFLICCSFLLPLVFHRYSAGITTTLLFGVRACISTTFTTVYIYAPELIKPVHVNFILSALGSNMKAYLIYPTSLRSTGVGAGSSMGRIGGMICPLVAVGLVQGCHQTAALALFTGVAFTAAICALLLPSETKGFALADNISNDKLQKPNVVKSSEEQ